MTLLLGALAAWLAWRWYKTRIELKQAEAITAFLLSCAEEDARASGAS